MSDVRETNDAIKRLRPGDTYVLPDGEIVGNIILPRGLSGEKGKYITIMGGKATRIIATDKTRAAFSGGGCRFIKVGGFDTIGGRNGVQFSQLGTGYDPNKMISDIYVSDVVMSGYAEDALKMNGGRRCHANRIFARGGNDQCVDFLGIDGGSIKRSDLGGSPCGIVLKGGTRNIDVIANTISDCHDGMRIGDPTTPGFDAPWMAEPAHVRKVRRNDISVRASPVVIWKSPSVDPAPIVANNTLATSHRSRGGPGALIRIVT